MITKVYLTNTHSTYGQALCVVYRLYIHIYINRDTIKTGQPVISLFTVGPRKLLLSEVVRAHLVCVGTMSSICETAKPIELKFCGKFPVGLGIVLG